MGFSPEAISGSLIRNPRSYFFYPDNYKRQETITPCFFLKKSQGADSFPAFYGPMTRWKLGEPKGHVKCFRKFFCVSGMLREMPHCDNKRGEVPHPADSDWCFSEVMASFASAGRVRTRNRPKCKRQCGYLC